MAAQVDQHHREHNCDGEPDHHGPMGRRRRIVNKAGRRGDDGEQ
jgi:hypothetical protein